MNKTLIILSLLLSACASRPTNPPTPSQGSAPPEVTPTKQPSTYVETKRKINLSPDLVYHTLASEIAAQRGDKALAVKHALQVARASKDAKAAERATSLGLQAKMPNEALTATQLWIEIAPEEIKAHQIAALLNIRNDQRDDAISHLRQVIKIANQQGQSGYLQAATIAEKSRTPQQALEIMVKLVPRDTQSTEALYALALTANNAKKNTLALNYLDQSLELNPQALRNLILKSHILNKTGRPEAGGNVLKQAADTYPENIKIREAYARTLVELSQPEAALEQFIELYERKPDNSDYIFSVGVLHMELEQMDKAKLYLSKLVYDTEKHNEADYYLGAIAEEEKELDLALEHYQRVDGERLADAQVRIAKIFSDRGDLNRARETLQQLRINHPRLLLKSYMVEAELLREAQAFQMAHDVYSKALALDENNPDLLYARGLNAADLKRVDLLEKDLRKILAAQPEHADALNALGYTLADQTERFDEAKSYIEKALTLKPDNPAILDSMGWVEYRLGNLETALGYLEKAAEISPNEAEISSHLGEVLWIMGKKQRALKVWNEAEKSNPDNRFIKPTMSRLGAQN
jgi:tetratricopeptide (TPR) repeat protein